MARSGVLYGPTGSRKTTAVKHFSHYIAEKTGKSTVLISLDGGGWSPCDPEIAVEMILPWRIDSSTIPLPLLRKASQGYFPQDPQQTDPGRINLVPIDWSKVGGVAVEGWTSIGQAVMRFLPDKGINVGGEDRTKLGGFNQPVMVQGSMKNEEFRSSTRGDYGFVQNQLYGLVMNFVSLPCEYVLFTALESKGEDEDRKTIYGPAIPGKAMIAQSPSWVGDCIHAADYQVPREMSVPDPNDPKKQVTQTVLDMVVRYYFVKHADPVSGIPFPAKPRVTPEKVAELMKRYPGGYFEPTPEEGFDKYLRTIDELAAGQADVLKGWREKMDAKLGRTASTKSVVQSAVTK